MNINLTNPTVTDIFNKLIIKLDLPVETIIELVLAYTDSDKVLEHGKQLSQELKQQTTE